MVKVRYKGLSQILTHSPPNSPNKYTFASGGDWVEVNDKKDEAFYIQYVRSLNCDFEIQTPQTATKDLVEKVGELKDKVLEKLIAEPAKKRKGKGD